MEEPVELLRAAMPAEQKDEDAVSVVHPRVRAFVPWPIPVSGGVSVLDALPSPSATGRVRSAIVEAIAAEGPISRARLARVVAEAFGLSRVSGARAAAILRLIRMLTLDRATSSSSGGGRGCRRLARCAHESSGGESTARVRRSRGDRERDGVVAELGGGVREDEIKREALRLFGGKRMTTQISERLAEALTVAVATRRVELAPSGAYRARS